MIVSIRHRKLKRFFFDDDPSGIDPRWHDILDRQLSRLDTAKTPDEMNLPGWRFHRLKGKPTRYALSVSPNWRLTFAFDDGNAYDVDLEDYH